MQGLEKDVKINGWLTVEDIPHITCFMPAAAALLADKYGLEPVKLRSILHQESTVLD